MPTPVRLYLDWAPNVIHSGILLAQLRGWFADEGIDLQITTPECDNYTVKPIQRLMAGETDLAIAPSEHAIRMSWNNPHAVSVDALATIMQRDMSAFVVKETSGITRPRDLDGRIYAGYNTPAERELLAAMIQADGGKGEFSMIAPARFDVWETFMAGNADTCWVFRPWESVLAERSGVAVRHFCLNDYGIPYGPTSLVLCRKDAPPDVRHVLLQTVATMARGYAAVAARPDEAAREICTGTEHPNMADVDRMVRAAAVLGPSLLDENGQWGIIDRQRIEAYTTWLAHHGVL